MDNISYIKELLGKYYPGSTAIDKIIWVDYKNGMLILKLNDGQKLIYSIENGDVVCYKKHGTKNNEKMKSVLRDIKLSNILD